MEQKAVNLSVNPVTDHHDEHGHNDHHDEDEHDDHHDDHGHDDDSDNHDRDDHDHSDHHPDEIANFGVLALGPLSTSRMYSKNGELTNIDLSVGAGVSGLQNACSVAHNNKMWVFGGVQNYKRQVLEVTDCEVQKVGELDFDFSYGSCAVAHNKFYLCFDDSGDKNVCRTGNEPLGTFTQISSTGHGHSFASMAASGSE